MPNAKPPGEVPDISVSGSQGIQVGSGIQYNAWLPKPPLDPAVLGALNPHHAVMKLRQLSHDELVEFFARAKPDDVGEIISTFAEVDLTTIVAALGDIKRRKATELIGAAGVDRSFWFLKEIPEAAEAIARKAARWGSDAEPLKALMDGYARKYNEGHVFWSESHGVARTIGAIDEYWTEGSTGWGFPIADQEAAPTSPYGATGVQQKFQPTTAYSSEHGVFLITDAMCYENEGGSGGWLGFPVSDRQRNGQLGDRQIFEGGAIYSYVVQEPEMLRSFAVRREVMPVLPDQGWRPVSKEEAVVSSSRKQGAVQRFEVELESGTFETAVYLIEGFDPARLELDIWEYYRNLGAEKSWLGFPKHALGMGPPPSGIERFESGWIFKRRSSSPFSVSLAVMELQRGIGYPVSEQQIVGEDGSGRIQFFEKGVVTLRDGKYEVWLRPDSDPNPGSDPESPVGKADEAGETAGVRREQPVRTSRSDRRAASQLWRSDTFKSGG